MFWVRLKIRSKCDENITVAFTSKYKTLNKNQLEFRTVKCFWNEKTKQFGAKVCIPFSQMNVKNVILRYENDRKIMYKKIKITHENYKNKFIMNLDMNDDFDCHDDSLEQMFEITE